MSSGTDLGAAEGRPLGRLLLEASGHGLPAVRLHVEDTMTRFRFPISEPSHCEGPFCVPVVAFLVILARLLTFLSLQGPAFGYPPPRHKNDRKKTRKLSSSCTFF